MPNFESLEKSTHFVITGGTGFLGGNVALRLLRNGFKVTILGRNQLSSESLVNLGAHFISVSLSDKEKLSKAIQGADYVIHCAALASPWGKYQDFYDSNVLGTKNVARACLKHKVTRLVNISTPSIYFNYKNTELIKESDPLPKKQRTHYGKTKLLADQILTKAHKEDGLNVISIRPRAIFGPGDKTITPRLLGAKLLGKTPLINGGKAKHDFTYIDNVVDAIILCLTSKKETLGNFYNITNDEPKELEEIFRKFLKSHNQEINFINIPYQVLCFLAYLLKAIYKFFHIQKEPKITPFSVGLFANSQTLDITKAKNELGYSPKISIDEGLKIMTKINS